MGGGGGGGRGESSRRACGRCNQRVGVVGLHRRWRSATKNTTPIDLTDEYNRVAIVSRQAALSLLLKPVPNGHLRGFKRSLLPATGNGGAVPTESKRVRFRLKNSGVGSLLLAPTRLVLPGLSYIPL